MAKPGEPALPLALVNVTPNDAHLVLRGIGYRGGTYVDAGPMFPFTGAATTESRGVHVSFLSPVDYPSTMWTPNYSERWLAAEARSFVTPVQHRVASVSDGTSTQRKHGNESAAVLQRQSEPGCAVRCADDRHRGRATRASGVAFSAQVAGDPAAAIYQWVTYTGDGTNAWT